MILPWKSNRSVGLGVLGGLLCRRSEMELARKANKISLHLQTELVWVMGFSCCSVCLLVWSGTHGYPAWSTAGRSGGMKGVEERWGRGEGGGGDEDVRHTDLPLR